MTEHAPDRIWSGIDIPKTLAGALAAVCAAVIGSFLGVAGTLIGAALASIIGTVGTEVYNHSIRRGTQKLQTLAPSFVKAPAAVGTPQVAGATDEDSPSHTTAEASPTAAEATPTVAEARRTLRWKPILIGTALVFFIAMGAILAVESLAGQSLASLTGHDNKGGNTLTQLVDGDDSSGSTPSPAVSETPSSTPSSTGSGVSPSTEPTETPTSTAPATEAPTTGSPDEAPTTGSADQDQPPAQPDQGIAPPAEQGQNQGSDGNAE